MFKDWHAFQKEYNDKIDLKDYGYYSKNISSIASFKEKLNEVIEDIDYEKRTIMSSIKGFFTSLYNFWKFREIIWRDRFWDYSFLIGIMVFKLKDMEEHWVKDTHYEGDKFTKGRIIILRKRIEELEEKLMGMEEKHLDICANIVSDEERLKEWKRYKKEAQKEIDNVFLLFARNYRRFWD